ncbi:MAG TPA: septum formation inhibitor Maf [Clostridiaceae bacterium]|nr:septum formation inhibitor Maf [Clostridiaceae bacterium]
MKKIVLASASPRRVELLKQIKLEFEIFPSSVGEQIDMITKPEEMVQQLAYKKAVDVAGKLNCAQNGENTLVIGADTIVVKDGIMGKPKNEAHAFEMLKRLQGEWHEVMTGVAVVNAQDMKYIVDYEKTRVKFRNLSDEIINSYIKTGEPMDKAGAYGVQGIGAVLVERMEGCYFNVVGLPLVKLAKLLESFDVKIL